MAAETCAVQSPLLARVPGLEHGFGSRHEPIPLALRKYWDECKPTWKQTHGVSVAEVLAGGQNGGEVDALWTRKPGLPIAVVTADCVPILLARKNGGAIAAVHAGWRGTRARILRVLWENLRSSGESPADWVAAIGPAIGPCCYEVSEELALDFQREFSSFGESLAVPRHRILDLPAINAEELRRIGVSEIDSLGICTRCDTGFHSYRREGGGTRQFSMAMLRERK